MSTQIILKKSAVPGKIPSPSQLVYGELAINYADGVLHYKSVDNEVKQFKASFSASLKDGDKIVEVLPSVSELSFDFNAGFRFEENTGGKQVSLLPAVRSFEINNELLEVGKNGVISIVGNENVNVQIKESKIEFSIKQGPESGLDADTLDGFHASEFKTTSSVVERYEFETPSLQWTISHNRKTSKFVATTIDSDGNQFFAKIKTIDDTTFVVHMTAATAGFVDVVFND